jgi:uncharacterized RDD family membrane protein YckC
MRYRSDQKGGQELRYWAIVCLAAFAVTVVQWTLLAKRGQSLGKMAMNIRIVRNDNDSNPGFLSAVVLRIWLSGILSAIPCLGQLFLLIDILSIFSEERRCLHDWLAGTKVVDV